MIHPAVSVRTMRPDERKLVRGIARRSFPPQAMLLFSFTEHVLVAELEGRPVGGVVLDTFGIRQGRRGGIVRWFFVDPAARGQGVGQALVEAAQDYFAEQGCSDLFACVEGYNTSSARRWAQIGFGILSPGAQIARYGLAIAPVWYHTFHFADAGHFLWAHPRGGQPDRPWLQWWGAVVINAGLLILALWHQNRFGALPPGAAGLCALTVLVFLGARSLAMAAACRAQGLAVRYRAWESGFPLGVAIAALLGGYYANPGGLYPADEDWRYADLLPKLGPMALAGAATTLVLLLALRLWAWVTGPGVPPPMWRSLAQWVGVSLAVVDILLPGFPLQSYNGRRIWDWKPWVWVLVALATLALLLL